jgi:hypothetical protein
VCVRSMHLGYHEARNETPDGIPPDGRVASLVSAAGDRARGENGSAVRETARAVGGQFADPSLGRAARRIRTSEAVRAKAEGDALAAHRDVPAGHHRSRRGSAGLKRVAIVGSARLRWRSSRRGTRPRCRAITAIAQA